MPHPASRLDVIPPYLFAEIARTKREAIARGVDIIDLGIGDPDLPTPTQVIDALKRAVENPATHRYDESARGCPEFLGAAAQWYGRTFGVQLDPESEFCQVIGTKEGLAHLAWAYADPGSVVITPNPGYTVYKVNSLMAGAEVHETPLLEENGFLPIFADIPTDIARRSKLLYVCYPHNPTGAVATKSFYEEAVDFCRQYDILLVNDMAYAAVCFDGHKNPTVLQIPGAIDVAIEFHSLSKMYNMTGWRLGFAVGNPTAVDALQRLKSNLDSKAFPAVALAGAEALAHVENDSTMKIFQQRRDNLCDGLNAIGWAVKKPLASFYVWARVPRKDMSSADFARELLERTGVLCIPGNGYGDQGEGFVRMSLTLLGDQNGERFAEAVRRIAESGLIPARV